MRNFWYPGQVLYWPGYQTANHYVQFPSFIFQLLVVVGTDPVADLPLPASLDGSGGGGGHTGQGPASACALQ